MIQVLLVEDDLDLAATLIDYLSLEDIQCDHASNGVAGIHLMTQHSYDVILLDLNLPRLDGISVCQQLRQAGNQTPVLMLTARDQLDDKAEGFLAGTDDYLVKPFEMLELVLRVRALARRRSGQARLLRCGSLEMDLDTRQVSRAGKPLKLSPSGWRLLECLLRAAPGVVTRDQLSRAVWADEIPDSDVLKVQLFHLRKALDSGFGHAMIRTLPGQGVQLVADDD